MDGEMASVMYARLELSIRTTDLVQRTSENLGLVQSWYKKDYDRCARFARIFRVGAYIFLDGPPSFRSAAEKSASERYNKLLPHKQRPYKVPDVIESTVRLNQDRWKNTVSIHWAPPSPTSRCHSNFN